MLVATMCDWLPGTETKYKYSNWHPLRWMVMKIGLMSSLVSAVLGFLLLLGSNLHAIIVVERNYVAKRGSSFISNEELSTDVAKITDIPPKES